MRVAFLGNAPWSVPPLEALADSPHEVALVATRVPRPARRGGGRRPTPVAEAAVRLGLPLAEVETARSGPGLDRLAESRPEVLAVVAYGEILPPEVLRLPARAPINLHFSLLPELRGAAPVQRAILEGMTLTGVTTIRMDEGLDTGPILLQREEGVDRDEDAGSLGARLAALGGRLLVDTLDRLEAGTLHERVQDHARATYAPKLVPEDRVIRWEEDPDVVVRRVRALAPDPGATTTFRARGLKVLRASVLRRSYDVEGPPGTVVAASKDGPAVAAGPGVVRLVSVAPEGRGRMTGGEFVRGYRPEPGEPLG